MIYLNWNFAKICVTPLWTTLSLEVVRNRKFVASFFDLNVIMHWRAISTFNNKIIIVACIFWAILPNLLASVSRTFFGEKKVFKIRGKLNAISWVEVKKTYWICLFFAIIVLTIDLTKNYYITKKMQNYILNSVAYFRIYFVSF